MRIAETPEQVRAWFDSHPAARAKVESHEIQTKIGADPCYRPMTVDDVRFIEEGGWCGEAGTFVWFYPCGVPSYMCVEEPPAIEWPDDHEYHSPETFRQMKARHESELAGHPLDAEFIAMSVRHNDEIKQAMYDEQFAHDVFVYEMFNHEFGYSHDDWEVLSAFGSVSSSDYERGIAELGLPKRICEVYRNAAREVIECDPD